MPGLSRRLWGACLFVDDFEARCLMYVHGFGVGSMPYDLLVVVASSVGTG